MKQPINYLEDTLINRAHLVLPDEGEKLTFNGLSLTFKVSSEESNDQLGVYEITLAPHTIGAKLHYHRFMDETFIVTKGTLTMSIGDKKTQAPCGTVAYIPRFTPHGFCNDSEEEVSLILLFNPSQKREGFFKGLVDVLQEEPIDPSKYLQLYHKYDSYPVDTQDMLPIPTAL